MGYVALSAFLSAPIAAAEDIPDEEKTPEYWAERLGREWHGLPAEGLAEKLLPFFREFNRLCEGEKDNLVQLTASPADPQCDQLHAADYTAMSGAELYQACGTDAMQWAVAFNQHAVKLGYSNMDEGWLVGWFANPIMAMHDSIYNPPEDLVTLADLGADLDGDDMDAIEAADNVALSSEIISLRARIHALETALEPFAAIKPTILAEETLTLGRTRPEMEAPHYWVVLGEPGRVSFTADDLRRARSVLSEKTAGKAQEAPKTSEGASPAYGLPFKLQRIFRQEIRFMVHATSSSDQPRSGQLGSEGSADDIRALGWAVAVHNDYRLNGEAHTFWLFTRGNLAIKGEGRTDAEALNRVREIISNGVICIEGDQPFTHESGVTTYPGPKPKATWA